MLHGDKLIKVVNRWHWQNVDKLYMVNSYSKWDTDQKWRGWMNDSIRVGFKCRHDHKFKTHFCIVDNVVAKSYIASKVLMPRQTCTQFNWYACLSNEISWSITKLQMVIL